MAFRACFPASANPHRTNPERSLWDKGYAQGKYEYDGEFIAAGKAAFTAGLTLEDNQYRGGQKRALWAKGWWKAKHQADDKARAKHRMPRPRLYESSRFSAATGRFSSARPNRSNTPKSRDTLAQ